MKAFGSAQFFHVRLHPVSLLISMILLAVAMPVHGDTPEDGTVIELADFSLEELMEIEVFTASKTNQSIDRATAVVSIITEEDIRLSGARTLYEVLKRVPGFFPSAQATWTVAGSRGLTADGNDHILLLIDGHPQNSIVGQGYQQQDMLPVLQKVRKIEIIRGPGSVLWGSSAVFGIINVITKNTLGEHDAQASVSYGDRDGMVDVNYLRSFSSDLHDTRGIFSLSYWQSDGYDSPDKSGSGSVWSTEDAANVESNVEFPWGKAADWPSIDRHREGWEIYGRVQLGESHEIVGRIVESRVIYPWDTWLDNAGSDLTMRKSYLSYRSHHELGDRVSLSMNLFGDILLQNRFPYYEELFRSGTGDNRDHMQDQSNEERAFGTELTGNVAMSDRNNLKLGFQAVRVRLGPNRDSRFDISANTAASLDYPYVGVESGYDNTLAGYFEDIWSSDDDRTTLFFGGRLEHNDFREKKVILLPRAGLIQSLHPALTAKYVFNSGYLRPNAVYSKSTGIIVDEIRGPNQDILLVDKSEEMLNHEIQFYWMKEKSRLAVNFFYTMIDNYISFDANNVPQGYKNLGNAKSTGAELEGRVARGDASAVYFNYSFAKATLENSEHQGALTNSRDEALNYPHHIFNVGFDWYCSEKSVLNVNFGGWRSMHIVKPLNSEGTGGQFGDLDGEVYLDANFSATELFESPVDLSLYCMNALNNTDAVGLIVNNGVWHPRGRNLGARLSCRW